MRAGSFMEEVKLELALQDEWNLNRGRNYSRCGGWGGWVVAGVHSKSRCPGVRG